MISLQHTLLAPLTLPPINLKVLVPAYKLPPRSHSLPARKREGLMSEAKREFFERAFILKKLDLMGVAESPEAVRTVHAFHLTRDPNTDDYKSLEAFFAWWAWQEASRAMDE